MEYEVIINLKIDPDSYTFELGKDNHSDDVTELIHRLIYEVEDVTIDGEEYVATNIKNGTIYKLDSDGEILEDAKGEFVKAGYYKNGVSFIL